MTWEETKALFEEHGFTVTQVENPEEAGFWCMGQDGKKKKLEIFDIFPEFYNSDGTLKDFLKEADKLSEV